MGKFSDYFKDWLELTDVSYFKYITVNVAGEATYEASANLPGYLDETVRRIINYSNQEVITDAQFYIKGDHALASGITSQDKFVLPDDKVGFPQKIRRYRDETGVIDYLIVYL